MTRKQFALMIAVVLISATAIWLSPRVVNMSEQRGDVAKNSGGNSAEKSMPFVQPNQTIPSANSAQSQDTSKPDLFSLSNNEIQNLSVEAVIQSSKDAEQIYDLSESWPKGSIRADCAREAGAWLFCYSAGASQRALANPLKLNTAERLHHETLLRFAKNFCRSFPAIDARRTREFQTAQRDTKTQPIKRDPYDLLFTELLAISVATPIQERQAQETLAKSFQQSYCLRQAMPEVFIRLESIGYRRHLSFVSLIDELSSNEIVAAASLAAELAACRNGPACGPMGFMTMQVCQGLKNCKPEQTLFDIRRARTTPRVFQTAVEIANHYAAAEVSGEK